jgi:hypothetical protein
MAQFLELKATLVSNCAPPGHEPRPAALLTMLATDRPTYTLANRVDSAGSAVRAEYVLQALTFQAEPADLRHLAAQMAQLADDLDGGKP